MSIMGTVVSGIGEGTVYMKKYARYFQEKFGDMYPGTLNVRVDEEPKLENAITLVPGEMDLYPVNCYRIKINNTDALLVVPQVTEHPKTILEIASPLDLRETLGLEDGDVVEIEY